MLAQSTFHTPPRDFLPPTPSPLSPRRAKLNGRPHAHPAPASISSSSSPHMPCRTRAIQHKTPQPDKLRDQRRALFLKKVKRGSDDKRWEVRGEDMMRLDFVQRQRRWEAEQARSAPHAYADDPADDDEEEEEEEEHAQQLPGPMQRSVPATQRQQPLAAAEEEVEAVAQWEDDEVAFYAALAAGEQPQQQPERGLWSDDDEYDSIFSAFVDERAEPDGHAAQREEDAMDLS